MSTTEKLDFFWTESGKGMLVRSLERNHVDYVLREWQIVDVFVTKYKVLLKWQKRMRPLTDQELKEQYR